MHIKRFRALFSIISIAWLSFSSIKHGFNSLVHKGIYSAICTNFEAQIAPQLSFSSFQEERLKSTRRTELGNFYIKNKTGSNNKARVVQKVLVKSALAR